MATRIISDVAREYQLTPHALWYEHSQSQLLLLWRMSLRRRQENLAHTAVIMHAATGAAIVNTISGKETPSFQKMIDDLLSENERAPMIQDETALEALQVTRAPATDELADLKEF